MPEVPGCIQVDSELHAKRFCKGCSVPFRKGFIKVKIAVFRGKAC